MKLSDDLMPFLKQLQKNNNKEWFEKNKERYLLLKLDFEIFVDTVIKEISVADKDLKHLTAKKCLFRIYRDARFSKNKEPYKINFGAELSRGGKRSSFASYYMHIEPENSFVGGGIYMPEAEILKSVRKEIYLNPDEFKAILNKKSFKKTFGEIEEIEKLKKAPQGYSEDFPDIDLLRHKHYIVGAAIDEKEIINKNFSDKIVKIFTELIPFNAFLNSAIELNA